MSTALTLHNLVNTTVAGTLFSMSTDDVSKETIYLSPLDYDIIETRCFCLNLLKPRLALCTMNMQIESKVVDNRVFMTTSAYHLSTVSFVIHIIIPRR